MQQQFEEIKDFLDKHKIKYQVSEHEPVFTSEDAARVRGEDLKTGAKALVLKADKKFILVVVRGDKKIDMKKLKGILHVKNLALAKPEDVFSVTNCEIGSVHPFGNLARLEIYFDRSLLENKIINFNAGLHTMSIKMSCEDFVRITKPRIEEFSQ